jgi:hypothetical protein
LIEVVGVRKLLGIGSRDVEINQFVAKPEYEPANNKAGKNDDSKSGSEVELPKPLSRRAA